SWKLGYLERWKSRPTTTLTKATGSLAPTKPESGKRSKTRTRPECVGKARDYEMDFPLTHTDCAGAGLYVFTKCRGAPVGFIRLLQPGPAASLGDCTNYSIPSTKTVKVEANP